MEFGLFDFRPHDTTDGEFAIQLFGLNEARESASIVVTGFKPFFYAMTSGAWNSSQAADFAQLLKGVIKTPVACILEKHKKLYGFDAGQLHTFVKIVVNSQAAFNKAKRLWYEPYQNVGVGEKPKESRLLKDGYHGTRLYEANIPPLLRFFHITGVSPSGWASFAAAMPVDGDKLTSCTHELTIDFADIVALPGKESRIPFKICSFDIEASSSHGDFPVPVKTYRKLATNIVDLGLGTSGHGSPELAAVVYKAFHEETDKVSRVYPKAVETRANGPHIETMIQHWLELGVPVDAKAVVVTQNTIHMAFAHADDDESVGSDDEEEADDEDDDEDEDAPRRAEPRRGVVATSRPIEAMLADETWTREEKIVALDASMSACLPQLKGDEVTFIGSTFMRYGESRPSMNHCIAVNTCNAVCGATIESYATERDALLAWTALIRREDPDIVIGYNIFGFDYTFLFQRAKELKCVSEFLLLSKNCDEFCATTQRDGGIALDTTNVMLASGQHLMHYIRMSGRIQIDLLGYFRRGDSLSSYTLDSVAGYCIGDGIKAITLSAGPNGPTPLDGVFCSSETHLTTSNKTGLAVGSYIHIEEIGHTTEYYANGAKFQVVGIDDTGFTVAGIVQPDTAKRARWCLAKDDVTPKDLFRLCQGSADDRAIVAKYCIQDCNLVQMLLHKRDVITGYVEMAKICSVPISFLVLRGQGIKLTSYIAKKCRERNTLMPVINKGSPMDGYEGAEVLTPKRGFYLDNPVACLDYASLYPSAMMSENFCHSSKVWTKTYDLSGNLVASWGDTKYDNLEADGYTYVDCHYDTYRYIFTRPGIKPKKMLSGSKHCRFAQYPNGERAIMPAILEDLLKARKATRRLLKDEQDEFMQSVLEQRQLGYKLTANSLYGQCGAKTSTFYEIDIAACTTATGQLLLNYGKRIVEECYGDAACETANHGTVLTKAEYIYGDSVAKWTPVYVSVAKLGQRTIDLLPIEELASRFGLGWTPAHNGKQTCEMLPGVETWSDVGWTRLERVIKHDLAPNKRMIRVNTPTGLVDVTDDHSLLLASGEEVSPVSVCKALDAGLGVALMHAPQPRQCTAVWWHDDPVKLQRYYAYECRFKKFGEWLRVILGGSPAYQFTGRVMLEEHQQTLAAVIYYTATEKFGFGAVIQLEPSAALVQYERCVKSYIVITVNDSTQGTRAEEPSPSLVEIAYRGPVYDLTTANHHFAAGVGQIVVHNTDSVFFTFNLQNMDGAPIRGKDALEITIELAQQAGHLASRFLKAPHDFEYEKTFMPFLLLSKKRYVGMLYELNHARPEKRKEMGIVLKRRDNAPIVKDIYGGIIDTLMQSGQPQPQSLGDSNIKRAIDFLRLQLRAMVDGQCPMSKLVISKSLRTGYKNPRAIAHAVLANRITEREPGNKPTSGDRIQYVYFVTPKPVKLQGDRIETPQYILDHKLPVDYAHYVSNQIMKPVSQIFELLIETMLENKPRPLGVFRRQLREAVAAGTEDKFRTKEVKRMLFDEFLRELENKKNGNKALTAFFK